MNGFIIIDKPVGPSSAAVVAKLKYLLPKIEGKRPKIGHGGTLDPLASGLLPIGIGKATKRLDSLLTGSKIYEFSVVWGTQTATDDAEGLAEPVATSQNRPNDLEIKAILPTFTGPIEQTPPAFSALKIGGKRAYDLARSGLQPVMTSRPVVVYRLELLQNSAEMARFCAEVGKGTYIRSLARDIALAVGTVGYVGELRRTGHGPFTLQDAVTLDKLAETADIAQYLLPLDADLARRVESVV